MAQTQQTVRPQNPQMQKPMSIFDVINLNVNVANENIHTLMQQVADLTQQVDNTQQEVIALSLMFKAPEQPKVASGEDGAETE